MFESVVKSLCGLRSFFGIPVQVWDKLHSNSASKKISILGNVTWEGGCVIHLTQHNCPTWKLHGKSWLVLMNNCTWFRGEILCRLKKKKKCIEIMKEQNSSEQEICYCQYSYWLPLLCFQGTTFCSGCMGSGIDDQTVMTSGEVVSPLHPLHGEYTLCQGISQVAGAGDQIWKMLENTLKRHVIHSDLCTVFALQESLPTGLMFLPWHYSSRELNGL